MNQKIQNREYDFIFKVVITGDSGVGKSQLMTRISKNQFSCDLKSTIGVEFATKVVEVDGRLICVHIWDTAGQERFRSTCSAYYKGAVGSLIVYDITKISSFQSVQRWRDELDRYTTKGSPSGVPITSMLLGNKLDLRHIRSVSRLEAQHLARDNKMFFMETSALDATNVQKAFDLLIREIYEQVKLRHLSHMAKDGAGLESGAQVLKTLNSQPKSIQKISTKLVSAKESAKGMCRDDIRNACPRFGCLS